MKMLMALMGWFLVAGSTLAILSAHAADPAEIKRAEEGVAKLGWDLVRAGGGGNVIVSPISVWEALAMTHAGARGATAAEIAAVLGMPDDGDAIAAAAESIRSALDAAKGDKITLDVANRLWVQRGKAIEAPFAAVLEQSFGASPGSVDFAAATEDARSEINRWVSEHTARKIDELLKPGVVQALTRVVLTNAVYMKAPWAVPFAKVATAPAPFSLTADESVELPFMNRSAALRAGKVDGATVVEIPYAGEQLVMIVAVPEAVGGANDVVAVLGPGWRERWSNALRRRPVVLALPRFTAHEPLSLADALAAMGMRAAFQVGTADFSGIDGTMDLFVSAVVHEGFVEVTEEGTEAAAATGVVVRARSAAPIDHEEPLVVKADRPFVWAVVERTSGAILFAGVVRDPRG